MKWNPLNSKVGLALGGGAAKGLAHVGILKAIENEGVKISCVAGTSVGALVASYYAFDKRPDDMMSIGKHLNHRKLFNLTWKKYGFIDTSAIESMVLDDLGPVNIEDAKIPLAICATDILTGEKVIFTHGPLVPAICASMAVPGLFVPVEINGRMLADGGIVENVPISCLEKMGAGIKIAVNLNGLAKYPKPDTWYDVVANAIDIGVDIRTRGQLKDADVVISLDLSKYSRLDNTEHSEALFHEGMLAFKRQIQQVRLHTEANIIFYILKALKELTPVKIPLLINRFFSHLNKRK